MKHLFSLQLPPIYSGFLYSVLAVDPMKLHARPKETNKRKIIITNQYDQSKVEKKKKSFFSFELGKNSYI
jgi:hypothetical protein